MVSDLHGGYLYEPAFNLFMQAYTESDFDQLVLLGDLVDAQRASSHAQRFEIMNPVKPRAMDFHEEIDYTIENILKPLRNAHKKTPIMFIPGNHERRVIRALKHGGPGIEQLYEASARTRRSVYFEDLLNFEEFGIKMEFGEDNYGVFYQRHRGAVVAYLHGYKTNKNRLSNYLDYFQCNVLTGHTHKGLIENRPTRSGVITAAETMCMRTTRGIEFMDEGHDPGWKNGFVTVWIHKVTGQVYIKQHEIVNDELIYKNQIFTL